MTAMVVVRWWARRKRAFVHPTISALFLFRCCRRPRPFAHDQQHGVLILCAVPVHLLAEMGDKAAGGHWRRIGGGEFLGGAPPPRALRPGGVGGGGGGGGAGEKVVPHPIFYHPLK